MCGTDPQPTAAACDQAARAEAARAEAARAEADRAEATRAEAARAEAARPEMAGAEAARAEAVRRDFAYRHNCGTGSVRSAVATAVITAADAAEAHQLCWCCLPGSL